MSTGYPTLREKIGALICPRIFGDRQGFRCFDFPNSQQYFEQYPPMAFIVFGGEMESTRKLLNWISAEIVSRPPLFAADLEEGLGQQIRGGTCFPPMMALGAAQNPELAFCVGKAIAAEAREFGIRWLFGPVLDLARDPRNPVMGNRSFGADPELVESVANPFLKGIEAGGGIATVKHFPGHGSTSVDSHEALPIIKSSLERLERLDLHPFRSAFRLKVPAVMVGHLMVPALEPEPRVPATLSSRVIAGYLRGKLNYQGVVVTDALVMGGVQGGYDSNSLGLRAFQAGCDLLLMPGDPLATAQKIEAAVQQGILSEKRIDRSFRRLTKLSYPKTGSFEISFEEKRLDQKIAEESLTFLVAPKKTFLPLQERETITLHIWSEARNGKALSETLHIELERKRIQAGRGGRDLLVVFSDNRARRGREGLSPKSQEEIRKILQQGKDPVLLGFCSPFAIAPFVGECPIFLAYGGCHATIEAALDGLMGKFSPKGVLPVKLPE